MRAGSRHQNPLATMLCNFKARAAGGPARRPSRGATTTLNSLSGQGLRSSTGDPSIDRQPRQGITAAIRLTAQPQRVDERSIAKTSLIRGVGRPLRREMFSRPRSPDRPHPASLTQRQQTQSRTRSIDRNQSPAAQLLSGLMNGSKHGRPDELGSKKITAQLEDTGASALCHGQNCAEVQVACEHDVTVSGGPLHHVVVVSVVCADFRPVNGLKSSLDKEIDPAGRQVHIDENFHSAAVRSISRSCARHAA